MYLYVETCKEGTAASVTMRSLALKQANYNNCRPDSSVYVLLLHVDLSPLSAPACAHHCGSQREEEDEDDCYLHLWATIRNVNQGATKRLTTAEPSGREVVFTDLSMSTE